MQKQSMVLIGVLAILAMAFSACIQPLTPTEGGQESGAESTDVDSAGGEEITLYAGPIQVDCVGEGPRLCLLVKTEPDEEYSLFYNQIEGFEYVPGYEYELLVNVEDVANSPAGGSSLKYTLVEEVSATEVGPTLEGTPWQMVALADENGEPIKTLPKVEVTALFENGKVSGSDGCNSYSGSYTLDGVNLTIDPAMMGTMMACPDPIMKQATAYTAALTSSAYYAIVDNQLRIMNENGRTVVTYDVRVPTSLTGTTWDAIGYNNGKEAVVSITIGTEITAVFGEDGTLSGSAGCNNYTAGYEADDVNIKIGPAGSTRKICGEPEGIMDQESLYLAALEMAEVYAIDGDRLQLRTSEGSLVADYRAAADEASEDSDSDAASVSTETESTEAGSSSGEETTVYVGPTQADCVGAGPMICMLVKTDADEDYGLFYSQIEGFEYVAGYEYELLVNVEDVANAPADGSSLKYTLIEEVSATEVGPTLEGTPWQMVALADENGEPVKTLPKVEVAALFEDGRVSGTDGCNSYSGSYTVDGSNLTVGPEMMGTAMACPEPIMKQAGAYTAALTSAASYAIVDNQLRIMNDLGRVVVTYEEHVSTVLTGTTWNAIGYNNGKGGVVSIAIDTEITAVFGEDGTLSGSAGCNNYTAGYEADDVNIKIGPSAVTMMMCAEPEGIMEQESLYLAALEMAEVYSIDGDRLQLRTGEGSLVADYRGASEAKESEAKESDDSESESGTAQSTPAAVSASAGEMTESLANMEYKSEYTANGTAPLEDGKYSEEAAPGSASKIEVTLTDQGAVGELNGEPAAAVVLVTNPGGSGTFYDLAIVMEEDGSPVNVATTNLGDRVQVNSVAIENNQIVVDMVQSGPDDPMCCPTQHVISTYELQGDELVEVSSEEVPTAEESGEGATSSGSTTATDTQQVERDGIVGVEWHFSEFEGGDGSQIFVDDPSRYTLLLNPDGTANVKADCNNGSGSYQLDGSSLTIDIVAVTRALCAPDSLSDDYFSLLGDVVTNVEKDDMLALNLKMDAGNMLFQLEDASADQVHQPTQLMPQDAISIDPGSLATSYHWQVLPPTPYDASMPPVPVGAPPHAVVTFDYLPAPKALMEGGPYIVVYPVDEYVKLWDHAGNETIGNTVSALETLLEEQPATPAAPLPILPPPGAVNDLAVQIQYVDFASGSGIRFVGRLSQDASPILSTQTDYYYQGLTDDGRFYISMRWPVTTSALPGSMEEIAPDQQQAIEGNFETYMQQATESLNTLSSSEWAPDLAELDALISSLTIAMPDSE